MGDAGARLNLDALRHLREVLLSENRWGPADAVLCAIAEIEAARAAPTSPWLPGSPPAIVVAALAGLRDIALAIVQEVRRSHEAGPSRAERLVAYRCAALSACGGVRVRVRRDGQETSDGIDAVTRIERAKWAELQAHAMRDGELAAEREPLPS